MAAVGFLGSFSASANNGAIAFAYPQEGIVIDGNLADWSEVTTRIAIEPGNLEDFAESPDFAASFRVAYSLATQSLFVAVEVIDDRHVPAASPGAEWTSLDSHLLYIDRQHLPKGSGNTLYLAGESFRDLVAASGSWDPVNGGQTWEGVEVQVRRHEGTTVYEWRVFLGTDLVPNRSLGLDHLLVDLDPGDEAPSFAIWGEGGGKSANSHRLGDVLLLEAGEVLGELRGQVQYRRDSEEPLPSGVRITSLEHPGLWTQAALDEEGRYSLRLPAGEYAVLPAFTLTKPFGEGANALPLRIDDNVKVLTTVRRHQIVSASPLVLPTYLPPEYLFQREGVLHRFDANQALMIDTFIETYRQYYDVPGVSVALVKNGKLIYHRTFGVRNTITEDSVEETTLFEAASITKPVFTFAVMRLVERGLIDLDKPLHEYLPFPNIAADERSKKMTARTVLTHQSGLPNWAWGGPGGWRDGGTLELDFEPGSQFHYSGEAFNYLGRVVEKITGKGLAVVLREEVTGPLGMRNAYFALDEEQAETASIGHYTHFPVLRGRAQEVSPASSLHTEARDFTNFMIGLIEGKGLSAASYEEMLKPRLEVPKEDRVYENEWTQSLGLGFFLQDAPFGQVIEHGGNNGDFDCKFGVLPEAGDGYVIFTNSNTGDELVRAFELFLLVGKD